MDNIITVTDTFFKDLEEECFNSECFNTACAAARAKMTGELEQLDRQLRDGRDKTKYRNKGLRATTVKTIFGEVTFRRTLYKTKDESGIIKHVFLLDEALHLDTPGLFSEAFKNLLVSGITTKSYRACAKELSETTGQSISAMGVWNVIQELGGNLAKEEKKLVAKHDKGAISGGKVVPLLCLQVCTDFYSLLRIRYMRSILLIRHILFLSLSGLCPEGSGLRRLLPRKAPEQLCRH